VYVTIGCSRRLIEEEEEEESIVTLLVLEPFPELRWIFCSIFCVEYVETIATMMKNKATLILVQQ
jgi:hypothetical protein